VVLNRFGDVPDLVNLASNRPAIPGLNEPDLSRTRGMRHGAASELSGFDGYAAKLLRKFR
jgi:hypothetical protein